VLRHYSQANRLVNTVVEIACRLCESWPGIRRENALLRDRATPHYDPTKGILFEYL